jgi:hypothetical protein
MPQLNVFNLQEQRQDTNTSVTLTGMNFENLTRVYSRIAKKQPLVELKEFKHKSLK